MCFLVAFLVIGSSNIEPFKKNIRKKDLTSPLNINNSCCNVFNSKRLSLIYPMFYRTIYMLHILTVYTFLLLLFLICKYFKFYFFVWPQLVVKTKYIDTLIKLYWLSYLRQDIAVNHFIFSLLTWELSHKKQLHLFFVLGMKSSGYIHTQFLNLY